MLKGKTATALVGFALVGTAGTWAAVSYAVPAIPLILSSASYERAKLDEPQTSNSDAKGDRLRIATMAERYEAALPEPAATPAAFSLASASTAAFEMPKPRVELQIEPQIEQQAEPRIEPRVEPQAEPRKPAAAPKRAEPPRLLLDDAQISALRSRLKLSPTQQEFWPAVEVTLRNVVRQHARKAPKNGRGAPPPIDVNSPEVQQLISAAVPLIMRMSEAQKHEVRQLARIIGLHTVASRI